MNVLRLILLLTIAYQSAIAQPHFSDSYKQGLRGRVHTTQVICYTYSLQPDGSRSLQRGLLDFAGNAYAVDNYMEFDRAGFLLVEKTLPSDYQVPYSHRIYKRDTLCRIQRVEVYTPDQEIAQVETYHYDQRGLLWLITQASPHELVADTVCLFTYNEQGNREYVWSDQGLQYSVVLDSLNQCIEERAVLSGGEEHYHNFHCYNRFGKRVCTTFTQDNRVIEVSQDPYSDNVLDEGEIATVDEFGNWITKIFAYDQASGAIVVRQLTYYD